MTTLKEFILARSLLPKTGIHTLKEHFTSITTEFSASSIGELEILPTSSIEVVVGESTSDLVIGSVASAIVIDSSAELVVVDSTEEVIIEIDCKY
jgi:hypothetical protein